MTDADRLGEDRARLSAWLSEWNIHEALAQDDDVDEAEDEDAEDATARDTEGDPPPAAGDIRLLHPSPSLLDRRPLYVALLEGPTPLLALAIPFGPLSSPATPGELLVSSRRPPPVRVLCVWNRMLLPLDALGASWRVAALPRAVQADLRALLRAADLGREPPDRLRPRLGPPLRHPADPRHLYLQREKVLIDGVRAKACRWVLRREDALAFPPAGEDASDAGAPLRAAAERDAGYGHARRWAIGDTTLHLVASREGDVVEFSVETESGIPSRQLDEALIVTRLRHAPIRHGRCRVPREEVVDGFLFGDPSGQIRTLV